ncbi:MAG: ThuA domain-containing protein [Kiritimatiellae bacterium]|nr:ThuA domain-containing protein [Kiritimatiellia bacterium]MDD5522114.1 ThuA domain-containing protein [Kiritimatiellia bacterium]
MRNIVISSIVVLFFLMVNIGCAADQKKAPPPPSEADIKKVEEAMPAKATATPARARKILMFNKCQGYRHGVIPLAAKAFEIMGKKTGTFEVVESEDIAVFNTEKLKEFDAILLNNTTQLKLSDDQKKAMLAFVKEDGKGLIATHAAADNFGDWPEGAAMIGGLFDGHPWGGGGTWAVKIDDPDHPINKGFAGKGFKVKDEIYQIKGAYSRDTHRVLLSLNMSDPATLEPKGQKRADKDNAIAWIYDYGKGRVFYCSLGHNNEIFWNPAILQHYLDGIQFALGDLKVDTTPSAKEKK